MGGCTSEMLGRKSGGSISDLRTEAIQLLLSLAKVIDTINGGMSPEELGPRDVPKYPTSSSTSSSFMGMPSLLPKRSVSIGAFGRTQILTLSHNWVADLLSSHATETHAFGFGRIATERNTHRTSVDNRTGQLWAATVSRNN